MCRKCSKLGRDSLRLRVCQAVPSCRDPLDTLTTGELTQAGPILAAWLRIHRDTPGRGDCSVPDYVTSCSFLNLCVSIFKIEPASVSLPRGSMGNV